MRDQEGRGVSFGRWLPWLVLVAAVLLLVAHAINWPRVRVDGITLALLGLILAIPLLEYIRRIRIGEFEAEIAPREVARARAKVESELPPEQAVKGQEYQDILDLVSRDPQLGLAQLRIRLEERLKALHRLVENREPNMGLSRLADDLARRGVIDSAIASGVRDVLPLANRAVHGEQVRTEDAEQLARLGVRLLSELWWTYRDRLVSPIRHRALTPEEREKAMTRRYRVTTVVPLVDEPYEQEYELTQEGLDELLEGYGEYAEFITGVEPILTEE